MHSTPTRALSAAVAMAIGTGAVATAMPGSSGTDPMVGRAARLIRGHADAARASSEDRFGRSSR